MQLATVTTSDLSRRPGDVLRRVIGGERLLIARHKQPVATLQPLDGYVFQPFDGTVHDVFGWPIGGIDAEIAKLSLSQRLLLRDCYRHWRLWSGRLPEGMNTNGMEMLQDLAMRGLARKTPRGWELTGRGLAMHEALQREVA